VNVHGQDTPLPPDGLRPGQLGVVLLGRVIVGDIAATLVDLAGREIVQVDEDQDEGTWQLGASSTGRHRRQELHGYEKVLLRALPTDQMAGITDLAPTYLKAMARARSALIRDAVRRGWLRRFSDGQRTKRGEELALRIRTFQRELRRRRSEQGESAFDGPSLPYALHFGLVHSGELPLARFAAAWVGAFAGLPGWRRTETKRRPFGNVPSSRPSIDEQMTQHEAALWVMSVTGGW
jgi:hypothetical protein